MTTSLYGSEPNLPLINKSSIQKVVLKTYGMGDPMSAVGNGGGYARKVSNIELVRQNLIQLLMTNKGERLMLPNFGTSIRKFLFEPLDKRLFELLRNDILSAIGSYARNVRVLKIRIFPDSRIGFEGLNKVNIQLVVQLLDFQNKIIDLKVKI